MTVGRTVCVWSLLVMLCDLVNTPFARAAMADGGVVSCSTAFVQRLEMTVSYAEDAFVVHLEQVSFDSNEPSLVCSRQPAEGRVVTFAWNKKKLLERETNFLGEAIFELLDAPSIPFETPPGKASAAGVEAVVELPPALAAKWVVARRGPEDCRRWLRLYSKRPEADTVRRCGREAYWEEDAHEDSHKDLAADGAAALEERMVARKEYSDAQSALKNGDYDEADNAILRCLSYDHKFEKCKALREGVRRARILAECSEAEVAIKEKRFDDARSAAGRCLAIDEKNIKCNGIEDRVKRAEVMSEYATATEALRQGSFGEAEDAVQRCRDLDSTSQLCKKAEVQVKKAKAASVKAEEAARAASVKAEEAKKRQTQRLMRKMWADKLMAYLTNTGQEFRYVDVDGAILRIDSPLCGSSRFRYRMREELVPLADNLRESGVRLVQCYDHLAREHGVEPFLPVFEVQ